MPDITLCFVGGKSSDMIFLVTQMLGIREEEYNLNKRKSRGKPYKIPVKISKLPKDTFDVTILDACPSDENILISTIRYAPNSPNPQKITRCSVCHRSFLKRDGN
jgi:hypothetical protein